jgi:hypothetical protein
LRHRQEAYEDAVQTNQPGVPAILVRECDAHRVTLRT